MDKQADRLRTSSSSPNCDRWEANSYIGRIASILSYAIMVGGIITIFLCGQMVIASYSALPAWDGWNEVWVVADGHNPFSLHWLWRQNNEHRPAIPKLLLNVDLFLFRANQKFLLTSVFAIQVVELILLSWSMRVLGDWRGALWRSGTGLAAFCLFCPSQQENLVWGFQVCFVLPGLFATVSFAGLLLYWCRSRQNGAGEARKFLLLSILAALCATWSLASGNLLWMLLLAFAVFLKLPRIAVLSLAASGLASTLLYFRHYGSPHQSPAPLASLNMPMDLVRYVALYFGGSWVHDVGLTAEVIGIAGICIALFVVLHTKSYIRRLQAFCLQLVLIISFCVATAGITAVARLNFGLAQAFQPRYQTVALLFWCSLALLLLQHLRATHLWRYGYIAGQICLLAVLARAASLAREPIREAREHAFMLNVAASSLLTGVYEKTQLEQSFPNMDAVLPYASYMRQHRLSIFSGKLPSLIGEPLASAFRVVSSDKCTGGVESLTPISDLGTRGTRISGWAWDYTHGHPPSNVIAVSNGIIAGLAAVGGWRPDLRTTSPSIKSSYVGYTGYVREVHNSAAVQIYAIIEDSPGAACLLATTRLTQD